MRSILSLSLALLVTIPAVAMAQSTDSDGDGISNSADAYPCDPAVAAVSFAPAEGQHATLLFEDQWPSLGDGDFNDVLLSYNYVVRLDAQGRAVAITATFNPLALGGDFDNGLGLHLPISASNVGAVTRTVGSGSPQAILPSTMDAELTVVVSANLREFFAGASGPINSIDGQTVSGQAVQVDIELQTPTALDLAAAPFDPYIFRTNDPGHEVHRTMYGGTAAMKTALFGSLSDQSGPGRWFVDNRNLPFVLNIPTYAQHTKEGVDVGQLWPRILNFAATGGLADQDFYTGDTVLSAAYAGSAPLQPTLLSVLPVPNTSCVQVSSTYAYSGVIETLVIPSGIQQVTIRAEGGSGGPSNNHQGGLGAFAEGTFTVTPGETLHILAGGQGAYWGGVGNWHGGTGGGGSFVGRGASLSTSLPLIVAGGGGGASQIGTGENAGGIVTAGGNGGAGTDAVGQGWNGASGGAGYHANGHHHGDHPTCVKGQPLKAQSFINGGAGGYISNFGCGLPNTVRGGFGGGGGAGSYNGGGGGGYVGGNVSDLGVNRAGRAGTNYNAGAQALNGTLASLGDGRVFITLIGSPPPVSVASTALDVAPISGGNGPGACTALTVTNGSASTLTGLSFSNISGTDAAAFATCTAVPAPCGATLGAGLTCNYGVQNVSTTNGVFSAIAHISANGGHTATRTLDSTAAGFTATGCTPGPNYPGLGSVTMNYSGSIQTFQVPNGVCELTIRAEGGAGGPSNNHLGGFGGFSEGAFAVNPDDTLHVLVGQMGSYWGGVGNWHGGTGGGASFVGLGSALSTTTPLIVGGGGGGAAQSGPGEDGGLIISTGPTGTGGSDAVNQSWNGASGGAGYHANGHHHGDHPTCVMGQPLKAQSFVNGGAGGYISNFGCGLPNTVRGGFGGGGGAGSYNGGGGGGYVGGDVSDLGVNRAGRAGTNYNAGFSPADGTTTFRGDGIVTISW